MQSYADEQPVAGSSAMGASIGGGGYRRSEGRTGGGDAVGRYRTLYEQSVNPFEAFRGRVSMIAFG